MVLRAAGFRSPRLRWTRWNGRGGWRTNFGGRLIGSVIAIAVVAFVVLGLFLAARSEENSRVTPAGQAVGPTQQLTNPAAGRLREFLRGLGGTEIGTPTLSNKELARLEDRADEKRPSPESKADSGQVSTGSGSGTSSSTGSSGGSATGGGSSGGGSDGGGTGGGSGGGGSGGGGSGGGGTGGGSDGGGSDGGGSDGGGPGGGGPGGGG